ncbi:MAG: hypothetical protein RLZZ623_1974, partial [Actinomycetota bacterium]
EVTDGPWEQHVQLVTRLIERVRETLRFQADKEQGRVDTNVADSPAQRASASLVHARRGRRERALAGLSALVPYLQGASTGEVMFKVVNSIAAEIIWLTGDTTHLEVVETVLRSRWLPMDLGEVGRDVRLSLARLCAIDGRVEEASSWFERARGVFRAEKMEPFLAICDHDEAWMHVRHPGHVPVAEVVALLERCIARSDQIGLPGWHDRARELQERVENQP